MSRRQGLTLFALVVLAVVLSSLASQRSKNALDEYARNQCAQRNINAAETNRTWTLLAEIERHNKFIDDALRGERLSVYENAKITVPAC